MKLKDLEGVLNGKPWPEESVEKRADVAYDFFLDSLDDDLAAALRALPYKGENSSERIAKAQLFRLLRDLSDALKGKPNLGNAGD